MLRFSKVRQGRAGQGMGCFQRSAFGLTDANSINQGMASLGLVSFASARYATEPRFGGVFISGHANAETNMKMPKMARKPKIKKA
nr:MAG TPA: hypothetical protein [Herelleviridae sp.]